MHRFNERTAGILSIESLCYACVLLRATAWPGPSVSLEQHICHNTRVFHDKRAEKLECRSGGDHREGSLTMPKELFDLERELRARM